MIDKILRFAGGILIGTGLTLLGSYLGIYPGILFSALVRTDAMFYVWPLIFTLILVFGFHHFPLGRRFPILSLLLGIISAILINIYIISPFIYSHLAQ